MTSTPQLSPFSLEGETALITGGGTGIGLGIARCLAVCGARVVLAGRRERELRQGAESIGAAAFCQPCDVTERRGLIGAVESVEKNVGEISILVNGAGILVKKPAMETSEEEFEAVLRTHLVGAFSVTRLVARGMLARKRGAVLFIASMSSFLGMPHVVAYSSAKSGTLGLVRTLAAELSPKGVRVNAIAPGWIETEMLRQAFTGDPERRAKVLGRTPMQRLGDVEDVGWTAAFLCSPAAKFITGAILPVDGGASIGL